MVHPMDLAIHRISFLSTGEKLILQGLNLGREEFCSLTRYRLYEMGLGAPRRGKNFQPRDLYNYTQRDLQWLERPGCHAIGIWEPAYPWLLKQIYNPPFLLFIRSRKAPVPGWSGDTSIAMVGTRTPSVAGYEGAHRLAGELARRGISIVSGLARGIDTACHNAVLSTPGITHGVLGHGPDMLYPASNRGLASRILASGGALVSEYPPGTEPRPFRFPERNRIISGLTHSVIVLEAPEGSGALITVDYALEQGRDVCVLGGVDTRRNGGGLQLLGQGACRVYSAEDVLNHVFPLVGL